VEDVGANIGVVPVVPLVRFLLAAFLGLGLGSGICSMDPLAFDANNLVDRRRVLISFDFMLMGQ